MSALHSRTWCCGSTACTKAPSRGLEIDVVTGQYIQNDRLQDTSRGAYSGRDAYELLQRETSVLCSEKVHGMYIFLNKTASKIWQSWSLFPVSIFRETKGIEASTLTNIFFFFSLCVVVANTKFWNSKNGIGTSVESSWQAAQLCQAWLVPACVCCFWGWFHHWFY